MQCARDAGARPVLGVQPRLRLARLARRGPLRLPQGLGCLLPRGSRLERLFFLCLCLLGRSRRLPLRFLRVHGLLLLARLRSLRLLWRVRLGRRRHRDGSGHSCGRGRGRGRLGHCSDRWSRDRRRLCRRRGGHRRLGGCSCRRLGSGSGSGSGGCSGRWLGGRRRHGCYWRRLRHSCHRHSWLRHRCRRYSWLGHRCHRHRWLRDRRRRCGWLGHRRDRHSWLGHRCYRYSWLRDRHSWLRHSCDRHSWLGDRHSWLRHSCHRYSWLRHSCYRDGLGRCHWAVAGRAGAATRPAPTLAFELRPRWGGSSSGHS